MQQSFNETRLSTDLNTLADITDDTSSTLIHSLDQDINDVVSSSDVNESQSMEIMIMIWKIRLLPNEMKEPKETMKLQNN